MGGIVSQEAKPTLIGITKNLSSSYHGSNSNSNILWFGQNVVVCIQSKLQGFGVFFPFNKILP